MRRGIVMGLTLAVTTVAGIASARVAIQKPSQPPAPAAAITTPAITSPRQGDNVPRPNIDPPCEAGPGCSRVTVEGKTPPGSSPFLAVAPLAASPRIWLQPNVVGVNRNGSFDGLAYLGTQDKGAGESYKIFLFACKTNTRFQAGDVIEKLPTDCLVSDPVTVTRTRAGVASVPVVSQKPSQPPAPATAMTTPAITSPKQGDNVPRPNIDPPCEDGPGCSRVTVEGKTPPGSSPFLAVAPLAASPRIWIQPNVVGVNRNGSFDGLAYLGTQDQGSGQRYKIYVFACETAARFRAGDVIVKLPTDCMVSVPVTVTRTR